MLLLQAVELPVRHCCRKSKAFHNQVLACHFGMHFNMKARVPQPIRQHFGEIDISKALPQRSQDIDHRTDAGQKCKVDVPCLPVLIWILQQDSQVAG